MLQFLNEQNKGCYLETNKKANVNLYEHFGFRLMEEGMVPKSNVYHYAMRKI